MRGALAIELPAAGSPALGRVVVQQSAAVGAPWYESVRSPDFNVVLPSDGSRH